MNAFSKDFVEDIIIDIEEACDLAQDESRMLANYIDGTDPVLAQHQIQFTKIVKKLQVCKTNLSSAYDRCGKTGSKETSNRISHIATGCDWFVRMASVCWALQFFYSFMF
jgi:hypothetical protein